MSDILKIYEAYHQVYAPQEVDLDELYKGKHGQSEREYQDDRSDAGKRISGDSETGPNYYTKGRSRGATPDAPTKPGARPKNTPKVKRDELDYARYRHNSTSGKSWNKVGGERGLPEEIDIFDIVLEYLCVEGFAETLEEAEWMMANELDAEDIAAILEGKKEPDLAKMKKQEERHRTAAVKQRGGSRGSSKNRAMKMGSIRGALERGEDPRADGYGGKRAERGNPPEDHRAAFSKNPLNNPPRPVKKPGV